MEKKYDLSFLKDIELTEDRKKELEKFFAEYEKILKEKHEKQFFSQIKKDLLEYHRKNKKLIKKLKAKNKKLTDVLENKLLEMGEEIINVSEQELSEAILKDPILETFNKITSLIKPFIKSDANNVPENNIITEEEIKKIMDMKGEKNMRNYDFLERSRRLRRLNEAKRFRRPSSRLRRLNEAKRFRRPSSNSLRPSRNRSRGRMLRGVSVNESFGTRHYGYKPFSHRELMEARERLIEKKLRTRAVARRPSKLNRTLDSKKLKRVSRPTITEARITKLKRNNVKLLKHTNKPNKIRKSFVTESTNRVGVNRKENSEKKLLNEILKKTL